MDFSAIEGFSQKELDQFKSVCNQLLAKTYILRSSYLTGKGTRNNPDYIFLSTHFETVQGYLGLLDWDLHWERFHGYFYVLNSNEVNRLQLTKIPTVILLALRMFYDENEDRLGLEHDVICSVRDVLEKVVTDYAILSTRPNMDDVKRGFAALENHCIIQRIEGRFSQPSCKFAILPTILTAVSSQRLEAVVSALRKEEDHEEDEEDSDD